MHIVHILLACSYVHWWLLTCTRSSELLSRSIKPEFVNALKVFGEFKAALNATAGIRDSLNHILAEIKQSPCRHATTTCAQRFVGRTSPHVQSFPLIQVILL